MNKQIERLANNCGVGEFSDSTVIEFIKDALYNFGLQCYEAGFDAGGTCEANGGFNRVEYVEYLDTLK